MPSRIFKVICMGCREYSSFGKTNTCYKCGSVNLCTVNKSFRPPKKTDTKTWKLLQAIFDKQKNDGTLMGTFKSSPFLRGFRTTSFRSRRNTKQGVPRKVRDTATLLSLL